MGRATRYGFDEEQAEQLRAEVTALGAANEELRVAAAAAAAREGELKAAVGAREAELTAQTAAALTALAGRRLGHQDLTLRS